MPLFTSTLDDRIKVEGKDATDRFGKQRRDFIRDACVEISTSQKYNWLEETIDITIPATITDWINFPQDFHQCLEVYFSGRPFQYISEKDYAMDIYKTTTNEPYGYFRIRYNDSTGFFQISFINGPIASSTVKVLYRKCLNAPEQFPDFMEETIAKAALARFLVFQEGDDLEAGMDARNEYIRLALAQDKLGNNNLAGIPRRTKTNRELTNSEMFNRYGR